MRIVHATAAVLCTANVPDFLGKGDSLLAVVFAVLAIANLLFLTEGRGD